MSFVALRLDVAGNAADALADALLDAGALSVDAADPCSGTARETPLFDEPGDNGAGLWAVCRLTALFPATADAAAALRAALAAAGVAESPHETFAVPEQDWVRATQAQFAPIRIDKALWVVPSWCPPPDPDAVNLVLDPGLAFGTGSHPTTQLCLRWLARELRANESVLDYGCGSGILAIAAALLGAGRVVGVDIDPQALCAARANATRNGVGAVFLSPDALADSPELFDVIVANILANPLKLLAPALARRIRFGGRVVLSGVLAMQSDDVAAAYRPWFRIDSSETEDGWVALAGTRIDTPHPG